MVSLSLGISFSGLLHFMLDHFAESVVLVLSQLIASDVFETRSLDSLKLLREVPPMKMIELASSEMKLDSEFKNFKAVCSRSEHARKIDVSADSIKKQEHLFFSFQNEGASSNSKQALDQSGLIVSNPRKRVCSNFCEGEPALQASEAEDLNTRLQRLEEESEVMKQAFLEIVVERKRLINEICQLFETLHYTILNKDKDGYGTLVTKPSRVFQFEP
ncbi:uncharacterized protein LOC120133372 [Hibiscus syriacus]|uniref:uncharacterized protein LOC120133372 n=1 Tax=Hibiscus syriacus TaxID=106335 RepID=UPI001923CBCB|nr:uncharacterized protein LOC120133372 [Hibiscus syriacus]